MSSYECDICDISLNSESQWEQHLNGGKHLAKQNIDRDIQQVDTSEAELLPDGISYKCKYCDDIIITGHIPLKQHLKGQKHQKKKLQSQSPQKVPVNHATIGNDLLPLQKGFDYGCNVCKDSSSSTTVSHCSFITSTEEKTSEPVPLEERVKKAWNHKAKCGYTYEDSFSSLSLKGKIEALSSHFGFVSNGEPIPNLLQYLAK